MGFLIFAFRKLCLKRTINQNSYRQMTISMQRQRNKREMDAMEQAKTTMQNAWGTISNSISSSTSAIFNAQVAASQTIVTKAQNDYTLAAQTGDDAKIRAAQANLDLAKDKAANQYNMALGTYQIAQTSSQLADHAVNSVFGAADEAQLSMLHQKDQQYEEQMASLTSEATLLAEEYKSVEKAEGEAAKSAAPSFGIA